MFYEINKNKIIKTNIDDVFDEEKRYFGFIDYSESEDRIKNFGFDEMLLTDLATNKAMVFESHESFDFIRLNIINHKALYSNEHKVCIYLSENIILFVYNNFLSIETLIKQMTREETSGFGFDRLLFVFFEKLTAGEVEFLEKIEQEISELENALITNKKTDCVKEIVSLRKRLMALKKYYEQLLNILDGLQENENDILMESTLRYIKIFSGKVDRCYHNVLNLRDYVTQVREAYQAQVDIGLNNIMKIFTVITAIFLPLTLLVGWYGMNLQIPEYSWRYGYPVIIAVSIAIVLFLLYYFKKHKWF